VAELTVEPASLFKFSSISEIVVDARDILEVEEFGSFLEHLLDLVAISSKAVKFTCENHGWR